MSFIAKLHAFAIRSSTFRTPGETSRDAFLREHPAASDCSGDAWFDYRRKWCDHHARLVADASGSHARKSLGVLLRAVAFLALIAATLSFVLMLLASAPSTAHTAADALASWIAHRDPAEWEQLLRYSTGLGLVCVGAFAAASARLMFHRRPSRPTRLQQEMRDWAQSYWMHRCGVHMRVALPGPGPGAARGADADTEAAEARWPAAALAGWPAHATGLPYRYLVAYFYSLDSRYGEQRMGTISVARSAPIASFADVAALTDLIEKDIGEWARRYVQVVVTGWTPYAPDRSPPKERKPLAGDDVAAVIDLAERRSRMVAPVPTRETT